MARSRHPGWQRTLLLLATAACTRNGAGEKRAHEAKEAGAPVTHPPESAPSGRASDQEKTFGDERENLVRETIEKRGIKNARVLGALRKVPCHAFVPEPNQKLAYGDRPLPIGHGQTISQPYIVALMTEAAAPKATDKCLEIGTGSGYQAAILAELCARVFSIEYVPELAELARRQLRHAGYGPDRVELRTADGYRGWPEAAPFDVIVVTAAPPKVPAPLEAQLAVGGRRKGQSKLENVSLNLPPSGWEASTPRVSRRAEGWSLEARSIGAWSAGFGAAFFLTKDGAMQWNLARERRGRAQLWMKGSASCPCGSSRARTRAPERDLRQRARRWTVAAVRLHWQRAAAAGPRVLRNTPGGSRASSPRARSLRSRVAARSPRNRSGSRHHARRCQKHARAHVRTTDHACSREHSAGRGLSGTRGVHRPRPSPPARDEPSRSASAPQEQVTLRMRTSIVYVALVLLSCTTRRPDPVTTPTPIAPATGNPVAPPPARAPLDPERSFACGESRCQVGSESCCEGGDHSACAANAPPDPPTTGQLLASQIAACAPALDGESLSSIARCRSSSHCADDELCCDEMLFSGASAFVCKADACAYGESCSVDSPCRLANAVCIDAKCRKNAVVRCGRTDCDRNTHACVVDSAGLSCVERAVIASWRAESRPIQDIGCVVHSDCLPGELCRTAVGRSFCQNADDGMSAVVCDKPTDCPKDFCNIAPPGKRKLVCRRDPDTWHATCDCI